MIRLAFVLMVSLMATGARADDPELGLLWNRTGLPLLFPLHIQSDPGRDYYLKLVDAETGDEAMAAYFEGGELFRVLAPPGKFRIELFRGDDWRDESELFGEGDLTERIPITALLKFGPVGFRTRKGVLLDVRGE